MIIIIPLRNAVAPVAVGPVAGSSAAAALDV